MQGGGCPPCHRAPPDCGRRRPRRARDRLSTRSEHSRPLSRGTRRMWSTWSSASACVTSVSQQQQQLSTALASSSGLVAGWPRALLCGRQRHSSCNRRPTGSRRTSLRLRLPRRRLRQMRWSPRRRSWRRRRRTLLLLLMGEMDPDSEVEGSIAESEAMEMAVDPEEAVVGSWIPKRRWWGRLRRLSRSPRPWRAWVRGTRTK
jgi:hypothetical protein